MSAPEDTGDKRDKVGPGNPPKEHRFKPGNPGRPKGSRNKLGEAFIAALHNDFTEHGVEAIQKVREEKPDAYMKVIASILPKELNIKVEDELSDAELDQRIRQLASAIGVEVGASKPSGGEAEADSPELAGGVSSVH